MAWTNGHTRTSTTNWKKLRRQAKQQLPYHCQQCGATQNLELAHKTPHFQGGTDTIENVHWLCHTCHKQETKHESHKARGGKYKRQPRLPIGKVKKHH